MISTPGRNPGGVTCGGCCASGSAPGGAGRDDEAAGSGNGGRAHLRPGGSDPADDRGGTNAAAGESASGRSRSRHASPGASRRTKSGVEEWPPPAVSAANCALCRPPSQSPSAVSIARSSDAGAPSDAHPPLREAAP